MTITLIMIGRKYLGLMTEWSRLRNRPQISLGMLLGEANFFSWASTPKFDIWTHPM